MKLKKEKHLLLNLKQPQLGSLEQVLIFIQEIMNIGSIAFQGVVKVETKCEEEKVLMKSDYGIVNQGNSIVKLKDKDNNQNPVAWINNEFIFTSMPLKVVYEEIERQFDIEIKGKEYLKGISTFSAKRVSSPEEIINMIGKPSGVKCIKISENEFIVEQVILQLHCSSDLNSFFADIGLLLLLGFTAELLHFLG